MNIAEAWEVVRDQAFGLGSMERSYVDRVEAFRVLQPIIEAAAKITEFDLRTEDWPSEELHAAILAAQTKEKA